jgi:hypothetical protein
MRSKRFTASLFSSYDGLLIFGKSPISASRDARRGRSSVRLRRISPTPAHPGDCLLSDHIAGVRPVQRERVFVPLNGHRCRG